MRISKVLVSTFLEKMPRNYARKSNNNDYSEGNAADNMRDAIEAYINNEGSLRAISEIFNVRREALRIRINQQVPIDGKQGQKSIFTIAEENELASIVTTLAQRGFPMTKYEFLEFVRTYCLSDQKIDSRKTNKPLLVPG